ncbi:MAG: hypothetical protein EHM25_01015 [Nitrosopumilales archaeon]|nr:MAG: hypothetical protein EHM25_01015 [Nitrosopumilales archaeon]
MIDDRLKTNKPFIVTTNKSLDDIKNIHDMSQKRIYDRVIQVCHPIIFDGVSRRREKANNNFRETNDLLGI